MLKLRINSDKKRGLRTTLRLFASSDYEGLGGYVALVKWGGLLAIAATSTSLFAECVYFALVLCPLLLSRNSRDTALLVVYEQEVHSVTQISKQI